LGRPRCAGSLAAVEHQYGAGEAGKSDRSDGRRVREHDDRQRQEHRCQDRRAGAADRNGGRDDRDDPRKRPDACHDAGVSHDRVVLQALDGVGNGRSLARGRIVCVLDMRAGRQ
jgi:hypothetical protein